MSYFEDLTGETVNRCIGVIAKNQVKEVLESYWPDAEAIEEDPILAEFDNARAWALDGFYDNNHDSNGETGIEMVCALLDMAAERLDPSLAEDYDPLVCRHCGSEDVEMAVFVSVNTNEQDGDSAGGIRCECTDWADTLDHGDLIQKSKFTK